MRQTDEEMQDDELKDRNFLEARGIKPCVCDEFDLHVVSSFNTLTIRIDGSQKSDLDWKRAKIQAEEAVAKGFALFWDINLGLFEDLVLPIDNQTQFLSLALSLDHFKETLWKDYRHYSAGLSIFRGGADFSQKFKWDGDQINRLREWLRDHFSVEEKPAELVGNVRIDQVDPGDLYQSRHGRLILALFCRDVCVEYLNMLAMRLPDSLPCYLFLDASSCQSDPLKQLQLLNPDRFDFFQLALDGAVLPFRTWGWQSVALSGGYSGIVPRELPSVLETNIGVCLPLMDYVNPICWSGFEPAVSLFMDRSLPVRLISENRLITEWDGLDFLVFNPKGLSPQGKRKLQGFCAAGGLAVSMGELIGLSNEVVFSDWPISFKKNLQ